jgi:ribosomal protein L29
MKDTFAKLKTKSQKELVKLLAEKKDALQSFKLGNTRSKTKNVKEGRVLRKEIAQILTVIDSATK